MNRPLPVSQLIAHRGYSGRYPENTLLSYKAAHQHGARFVELDLQMTEDRVPILHHDTSLKRMSGVDLDIRDIKAKQLKQYNASYPSRFSDEFSDNTFTTFKKFCKWLKQNPDVTAFVEFKQETIDRIGIPIFVDEVYRRVVHQGVEDQCVFISFNQEITQYTRKISPLRTGWVIPRWNDKNQKILTDLKPEFAFCDKAILPNDNALIWRGIWQWAIYNLDDVASAQAMLARDFAYIETNQIGTLMSSK